MALFAENSSTNATRQAAADNAARSADGYITYTLTGAGSIMLAQPVNLPIVFLAKPTIATGIEWTSTAEVPSATSQASTAPTLPANTSFTPANSTAVNSGTSNPSQPDITALQAAVASATIAATNSAEAVTVAGTSDSVLAHLQATASQDATLLQSAQAALAAAQNMSTSGVANVKTTPRVTAGVYKWSLDAKGNYTGAYLFFDVVATPDTVLNVSFTFSGPAMKAVPTTLTPSSSSASGT